MELRTGKDGEATFVVPDSVVTGTVLASRDGYQPASAAITSEVLEAGRVELRLVPVAGIARGRVVWEDGAPVAGARVLAWPSGRRPSVERVVSLEQEVGDAADGADALLEADTTEAGAFTLSGLDRGRAYTVTAVALGAALSQPPRFGVRAGDALGDLVLRELYGVALVVTAPGGAPLPLTAPLTAPLLAPGDLLDAPEGAAFVRLVPELALADPGTLAAEMLRRERAGVRYEWDRLLLLWYGPRGLDELGGFEYRIRLPGYEELAGRVPVRPLSEGLGVEPLTARCVAEGFGELRLTVAREVPPGYAPDPSPLGALHLHPEPGGEELILDVSREPYEPQRIKSLPWGFYRAVFAAADAATVWPEEGDVPVVIGSEPARLVIDLTFTCTREVVVREPGKSPYSGRLTLRLDTPREEDPGWVMRYILRARGPYFLDGLRPGREASLRVRFVPGYDASAVEPVSFRPTQSSDPPVVLRLASGP